MRVTTNGTMLSYKSSLMKSANQLNFARDKVLSSRSFSTYAEDPAAATQAFKLRRLFSRTNDQISSSNALISKYESAWTSVGTTKNMLEQAAKDVALRGESGSTAAGRQPLGEVLSSTAKSIVQTLNSQYAGTFIFGGSNADKAPFSWSESGGLLFQGVSVDAGLPGAPEGTPPDPSSKPLPTEWATYYGANEEFKKLAQMSHEAVYVDIGAGLSEDENGILNSASVFNASISGIELLGFGVDADGDSKNAVSLIKNLSDIYKRCDAKDGAYASESDRTTAERLAKKLDSSLSKLTNKWTNLDGDADYLKDNKERLVSTSNTLNEQILDLEQVNLADAIKEYSWAQYCYNSALKVGNSLLSQSLIDYMN